MSSAEKTGTAYIFGSDSDVVGKGAGRQGPWKTAVAARPLKYMLSPFFALSPFFMLSPFFALRQR